MLTHVAQHQQDDERIVEVPEDGDEVGYQVDRRGEIRHDESEGNLYPSRYALVLQQPLEEDGVLS